MIPTAFKASKPVLRFPEFSENWQLKKGGELFHSRREKGKAGIEIYSVTMNDGLIPRVDLDKHMHGDAKPEANFVAYPNDIAYNMMRMWQGAMGLANKKCMISPAYVVLQPKADVNSVFYLYLLKSHKAIHYLWAYSYGLTSDRLRLYFKDFSSIPFPYTTPKEQQKIVSFLVSVNTKIQQLKRKHTLMQQYKKGVMQQLFSQQVRFKGIDGRNYPEWEKKQLGDTATIGSGRDYKHLNFGDIPVYGTGGYMCSVDKYLYDGESVCIVRKGTIDKPALLDGKFWTVDTLFYTHNFKGVTPKFVYAIFQQINWKQYCEASGVPSLSKTTIQKITVSFPCIDEQKKITAFLEKIDDKLQQLNSQITQAETFKKGLLQQMFV